MDEKHVDPDLYTLEDENGELQTFELWDTYEENGNVYYALIPYYDDPEAALSEEEELVVLKLEDPDSDEETLITIDDDDEYNRIGEIFLEQIANFYDGEDDDEEDPE